MIWILIVAWTVAPGNYQAPYNPVAMQEFNTEAACRAAIKVLRSIAPNDRVACTPKGES